MSGKFTSRNIESSLKDMGVDRDMANYYPKDRIPLNSSPILGRTVQASHFPASNTTIQNQILREGFKSETSMTKTGERVKRNIASGRKDPVFSSWKNYEDVNELVKKYLAYSKHFADRQNPINQIKPLSSMETSNGYLHQAQLFRLYSEGKISEPEYRDFSLHDHDILNTEYSKLFTDFELTCHNADVSQNTPCNRFVSLALEKIYGVTDFKNFPNGDQLNYAFANQIADFVQASPNWHLIGEATSQNAIDAAALAAAEGRPVIGVKREEVGSGHAIMIHPGIPRDRSGKHSETYGTLFLPFSSRPFDTHTTCPWKGLASYYHVIVNGKKAQDAAWYYPNTKTLAEGIKGYVAFWNGVN